MAEAKKTEKTKTAGRKTKKEQLKHAEMIAEAVPVGAAPKANIKIEEERSTAKAGKRSSKSLQEAQIKEAKQERKARKDGTEKEKKPANEASKTRAERAGKKYREAAKLIDKTKSYSLSEAVELAAKTTTTKFDASVELHINLGVDPRQAEQNVRGMVVLPAGSGKNVRVAVFAEAEDAAKAKKAGADIAGADEITAMLDKEQIDFDVLIAVPALMPKLGKYARLLGPRGLMPNPKSGTVSPVPETAVTEAKAGRVEYRVDQAGIIHLSIGKASFGGDKLIQNAEAVMASVRSARPAGLKGIYIKSVFLSSTMGPSIKADVSA
jgi:large subunit ribosomal protein L1